MLFALCECLELGAEQMEWLSGDVCVPSQGTKTLPEEVEVAGYAIADVIAKCGIPMMAPLTNLNPRNKQPSCRVVMLVSVVHIEGKLGKRTRWRVYWQSKR